MAIRTPSGTTVNGVGVWIKDPTATAGLFAAYVRIPGVGSITLPDEAAPQNDIATIDGSVGAAGFAPVGTIAVPLPVASQHPTHRFLQTLRRTGKDVQIRVRRASRPIAELRNGVLAADGIAVASNGTSLVAIVAALRGQVKNHVREGHIVSIADPTTAYAAGPPVVPGAPNPGDDFLEYGTAAAALSDSFQTVVTVDDAGDSFTIAPGYSAASGTVDNWITVRHPGLEWDNISCQVAQMGDGDFQSASIVAGNLVLRPTATLPVSTVVVDDAA